MRSLLAALALALAASLLLASAAPEICFVVYQMADNDLEWFIRNDNLELINSCAVRKANFHTWMYFDGRDPTGWWDWDYIPDPLEEVWEKDGSELLTSKYDGSQYLTYDHSLSKMVVDTRLPGEQNGDDPETVYNFLFHALSDCVSKGATEYVLIFSSHGGGFYGFGGDDNPFRRILRTRGRDLTQTNARLAGAISSALSFVEGAPDRVDVMGFDACLMSSVSALAEYKGVAKYYLASEATEPGHGWAYRELCDTDSALDVAKDIYRNFLKEKQGPDHQAPKTLALIDSAKFGAFHNSLEAFAAEMRSLLGAADDPEFFALLQRSRASAVSFDSVLDNPGTDQPSAVDVGNFFAAFDELCGPRPDTALRSSLDAVVSAYDNMFVERGNGPGTAPATGMHVAWPFKKSYNSNPQIFEDFLFDDPSVTGTAPEWFSFVENYLSSKTPSNTDGVGRTCSATATSVVAPTRKGQLLLNPTLTSENDVVTVKSDITTSTDYVVVEYGIDGTKWLDAMDNRQLLSKSSEKEPALPAEQGSRGYSRSRASSSMWSHRLGRRAAAQSRTGRRRRMAGEDYLFVFGGLVEGTFDGPSFSATGARGFYAIGDEDSFTPIYLYTSASAGSNEKAASIPVMYFPEGTEITSEMLTYQTKPDDGVQMGGRYGALQFGLDEVEGELSTAITLITNNANTTNSTISETPPSAGGNIVPIIFVDAMVDGQYYDEILGGVDGTVIKWSEEQDFVLWFMSPEEYISKYGINTTTVLIDMYAFDFDVLDIDNPTPGEGVDIATFEMDINSHEGVASQKPVSWGFSCLPHSSVQLLIWAHCFSSVWNK